MNIGDQKDRYLIFGFLRKILNKGETKAFEERMNDEAFQDELSHETVNQYGRIQLRSKLDDIHQTVIEEQKRRLTYKYLLFAVLAILVALASWKVVNESKPSAKKPDQLFANYFEPYANLFDQKGEKSSDEQGLAEAMEAYSTQDYSNAVRLFELHHGQGGPKRSLSSFYYSIALLAKDESGQAVKILVQLKEESNSNALLPKVPIHWYLALANPSENNVEAAKPLLEWIASQKKRSFKQTEAMDILALLKD